MGKQPATTNPTILQMKKESTSTGGNLELSAVGDTIPQTCDDPLRSTNEDLILLTRGDSSASISKDTIASTNVKPISSTNLYPREEERAISYETVIAIESGAGTNDTPVLDLRQKNKPLRKRPLKYNTKTTKSEKDGSSTDSAISSSDDEREAERKKQRFSNIRNDQTWGDPAQSDDPIHSGEKSFISSMKSEEEEIDVVQCYSDISDDSDSPDSVSPHLLPNIEQPYKKPRLCDDVHSHTKVDQVALTNYNPDPSTSRDPVPLTSGNPTPSINIDPVPSTSSDPTLPRSRYPVPSTSGDPTPPRSRDPVPSSSGDPTPPTTRDSVPLTGGNPTPSTSRDPVPLISGDPTPSTSRDPVPSTSRKVPFAISARRGGSGSSALLYLLGDSEEQSGAEPGPLRIRPDNVDSCEESPDEELLSHTEVKTKRSLDEDEIKYEVTLAVDQSNFVLQDYDNHVDFALWLKDISCDKIQEYRKKYETLPSALILNAHIQVFKNVLFRWELVYAKLLNRMEAARERQESLKIRLNAMMAGRINLNEAEEIYDAIDDLRGSFGYLNALLKTVMQRGDFLNTIKNKLKRECEFK